MKRTSFLFGVPLSIFILLCLQNLLSPGFYHEEALHARQAKTILQGFSFPFGMNSYSGALKSYLLVPFFALFGANMFVIRGITIAIGSLFLVFVFLWVKDLFGRTVAFLTTLLVAVTPSLVFYSRCEAGPILLQIFFAMAMLFFLTRWWLLGRRKDLIWGLIMMLFGMYDRMLFLGHVIPLGICGFLISPKKLVEKVRSERRVILLFGFLVLAIFFYYFFLTFFLAREFKLVENTGSRKILLLKGILNGRYLPLEMLGKEEVIPGDLFLLLWGLCVPYFLWKLWSRWKNSPRRELFILVSLSVLLFLLLGIPGGRTGHHFLMIYPFPQLVCGWVLSKTVKGRRKEGRPSMAKSLSGIFGMVLYFTSIGSSILLVQKTHALLKETGGIGHFSDSIYSLKVFLEEHPERQIILADWGFEATLATLSDHEGLLEGFSEIWGQASRENLTALLQQKSWAKDSYYLFFSKKFHVYVDADDFVEAVRSLKKTPHLVKEFFQRNGQPVYLVYEIR
ncbi:MAG: glycosyltransferase family 39 protein [Candidatus Omnitrophica bacterium]|nr:glycosyltransferase family 39 protein [Candidatus Omnitrophota bacterium]